MRDYDRRGRCREVKGFMQPKKRGVEEDENSNIGTMYHDSVGNSRCLYNWLDVYRYMHIIIIEYL